MTPLSRNKPAQDRAIPFEGIVNARELGGLTMADGRMVRSGLLVRSGNLSQATDNDVALLKTRFRLSDVFDFRFDAEIAAEPDRAIAGVRHTQLATLPQKMIDGFSSGRSNTEQVKSADFTNALAHHAFNPEAQELARQLYPAIVSDARAQQRYGAFLRGVLDAAGGVLWHCSQGKDRAGWATAFVLAALGAGRETIVTDFDRSNQDYVPAVATLCARVKEMGGGEAEYTFIRSMVGVSTENFSRTLDWIDAQYGSLQAYLEKALGFSAAEQKRLQERYLYFSAK